VEPSETHRDTWGRRHIDVIFFSAIILVTITAFMAVLLYLPSIKISGLDAVISNHFVQPIPISEIVRHLPEAVAVTGLHWIRDLGGFVLLIGAGLAVSVYLGLRQRDPFLLLPLIAPPFLLVVAATQRVVPFPRVWLFLLPIFLVCAAVGLGYAVTIARKYLVAPLCLTVLIFVLAITQGARVFTRDYLISEDSRTLVDAEAIVRDLAPKLGRLCSVRGDESRDARRPRREFTP
jgi:hypothetical protein